MFKEEGPSNRLKSKREMLKSRDKSCNKSWLKLNKLKLNFVKVNRNTNRLNLWLSVLIKCSKGGFLKKEEDGTMTLVENAQEREVLKQA